MAEIMVPTAQSKRRKRRWGMIFVWLLFCGLFTAQAAYTILSTPNVQLLPAKETNADGSQVNPLDIVMLADTSGATKFIGQDMASGFQDAIAAAKITDDIRLVVRDTEGEVAKTSAVASGSASGFRTLALFGPTEQTGFESVRDAATEGLVVAITPVGSSSSAPNGDWTFSLQGPTRQSGFKLGRVLQRVGTGPLVAHLVKEGSEGSQFWSGVLGAFADIIYSPDVRSTPQMEVQWPFKSSSGSSDTISPEALASDAIIISLPAADAEVALRELREDGYCGIIVLSGEGSLANFPNRFKADPKEVLEEGYYTNAVLSLVPFTPSIGNAESQRLINDYRATHKADPSWAYAYGHDAGQLIAEFVASAKADGSFSLSNPGNTQQALQKFLKSSSTRATKLHGYTGDLEFSSRNERDLSPKIVVYQAGKQRPFYLQVGDQPHLKSQVKTGNETIQVGSEVFNLTPVVYTGINMRNLTNLDFDKASFDASFDLWLKASETIDFKDLTFINAVSEPKLVESQDTTTPQGGHYQHFLVQGSFRFIAQPADLLLDRASVSISLRHSRLDGRQFAFVIDPDAIDTVARRTRDSNFRVESSLIGVAESKQNALGDPRAIHGEIAFSVLRYEAELRRAKSTLTSRLVEVLGQKIVQLTFIGLLAAILLFTFLWIIRLGLVLQIILSVISIFILLFSQAALFTLPVAYSFPVILIEQIVMTYDLLLVFSVVRLIDLIVFSWTPPKTSCLHWTRSDSLLA
jgi:ABC-type branched-subunit amino acid transport system substrate-binding protein